MSVRINKYFTENGQCSRREADKLITEGRITINERVAKLGDRVELGDVVKLDQKIVNYQPEPVYIMYNKPRGITCTTELKVEGNIIDAIKHQQRVFPIGRLDKDSTGLIFLTNDGDIVNRILRAQFGHEKEYVVEVSKPIDEPFIKTMGAGVDIGDYFTKPCKVKSLGRQTFSIILTEGKNRQIRRMCEALNHRVRNLHRIRIMNIKLADLALGQWQNIPELDLKDLKQVLDLSKSGAPVKSADYQSSDLSGQNVLSDQRDLSDQSDLSELIDLSEE